MNPDQTKRSKPTSWQDAAVLCTFMICLTIILSQII